MQAILTKVRLQDSSSWHKTNTLKGDRVIATARARGPSASQRLASLKAAGAAVIELDITASQETLNAKAKEAWELYGQVDVLVNNAGFVDIGVLEEIE